MPGLYDITTALLMLFNPGPGDSTHAYTKYETENIASYRKVYTFIPPKVISWDSMENWQVTPVNSEEPILIEQPEGIEELVRREKSENMGRKKADGYRIQIYAGTSYAQANDTRYKFIEAFDDIEAYQEWDSPVFKVKVGNYLTREEAIREIQKIQEQFQDALIVSDEVKVPRYKAEEKNHQDDPDREHRE